MFARRRRNRSGNSLPRSDRRGFLSTLILTFPHRDPTRPRAPNWRTIEIPFYLAAGQRPDQAKLNVVFASPAAVRLKDIELLAAPVQSPAAA
jgi:hypothetical protein